ncbi:unnamed protein product [Sphenostylis stenocarpa]|uniref:Uncharacterized protein n=1 Tax=Sphenostylis stenocarpa TaxID=92480 RepID=A0AA86S6Z0_9FABA|nr:unnamed protein product [Sphenostylis stenocarpa]
MKTLLGKCDDDQSIPVACCLVDLRNIQNPILFVVEYLQVRTEAGNTPDSAQFKTREKERTRNNRLEKGSQKGIKNLRRKYMSSMEIGGEKEQFNKYAFACVLVASMISIIFGYGNIFSLLV